MQRCAGVCVRTLHAVACPQERLVLGINGLNRSQMGRRNARNHRKSPPMVATAKMPLRRPATPADTPAAACNGHGCCLNSMHVDGPCLDKLPLHGAYASALAWLRLRLGRATRTAPGGLAPISLASRTHHYTFLLPQQTRFSKLGLLIGLMEGWL